MNLDDLLRRWFFKVSSACLLLLAANAALYVLGVARLGDTATRERATVEANAKQIAELEAKVKEAAGKVGALESGRAALATLYGEHLKTRAERLAEMQREIDTLLREAGLTHEGLSYSYSIVPDAQGKRRPPQEYWEVSLRLSAEGSYPQIKAFLAAVQGSEHFFVLDSVAVRATTQGAVVLNLSAGVSTYFLAEPEAAAAGRAA